MGFFEKAWELMSRAGTIVLQQGRRIERSNEKTIAYIKRLRSAADSELRRIVLEENGLLVRDAAKVRAAKFILCNRG